ncbi:MAG: DUF1624 domain-containing protein [Acetatifactor sp.]|nr:DUF1624 domain-containing protein [Acetatifactor sp.]
MNQADASPTSRRLILLDEIRGLTLISMILYHFLWDLVYIAGFSIPWYHGTGAYIWQQSICRTFIFLSGFCWSLGRHPLKRGLTVWLSGGLVTLVTLVFLPENRVVFGVLTLIGSAMLLMIPVDRLLGRLKSFPGIVFLMGLSYFLFLLFLPAMNGRMADFVGLFAGRGIMHGGPLLPRGLYRGWFSAWLGFPAADFYSTDYFPLLPWFFLFLTGYLFHRLCASQELLRAAFLRKNHLPPAAFIGRHSLLIYLLHQPVLYGITMLIMLIK